MLQPGTSVATETVWPTNPKVFTTGPFMENVGRLPKLSHCPAYSLHSNGYYLKSPDFVCLFVSNLYWKDKILKGYFFLYPEWYTLYFSWVDWINSCVSLSMNAERALSLDIQVSTEANVAFSTTRGKRRHSFVLFCWVNWSNQAHRERWSLSMVFYEHCLLLNVMRKRPVAEPMGTIA